MWSTVIVLPIKTGSAYKGFSKNISFLFLLLKTSFLRLFEILDLFLISVFKIINTMAIRDGRVFLSNVQLM